MRIDSIKQNAVDFDISLDSAIKMRVRYLQSLLAKWAAFMDEQTDDIPESDVMAIIGELVSTRKYQEAMVKGVKLDGITDEMIQLARDYPIENLIEFQNGKALAFCHADKSPSLMMDRKRNRCHCFCCDKDFNALDVLLERDGYDFVAAVKQLAGV